MKKYILGAIVIIFLLGFLGISNNVLAANEVSCGPTTFGGRSCTWKCDTGQVCGDCSDINVDPAIVTINCKCNAINVAPTCATPAPPDPNLTGGSSPIGGLQSCFKLSQDIKIKNPLDPTGLVYITYKKDSILAPEKTDDCKIDGVKKSVDNACADQVVTGPEITGTCYTKNAGIVAMLHIVMVVTNWFFYILTVLVVFLVIWGGFLNITAAGDPEKASKGRKVLVYAVIGLAIALLAKIVPSVVKFIVGV